MEINKAKNDLPDPQSEIPKKILNPQSDEEKIDEPTDLTNSSSPQPNRPSSPSEDQVR